MGIHLNDFISLEGRRALGGAKIDKPDWRIEIIDGCNKAAGFGVF
jgi:hypothetical protein